MSFKLVRTLVSRSLGQWIPPPLRTFIENLYSQIDYIESERDFLIWLSMTRKLPAIYRRTGVKYALADHWSQAVQETPMDFFDAARTEIKDWSNLFIRVSGDTALYKKFWDWVANPFQVRMWLGEVVRKFHLKLFTEHQEMLEAQRNPGGDAEAPKGKGDKPSKTPEKKEKSKKKPELDPANADTWAEAEMIEKRIQQLKEKANASGG